MAQPDKKDPPATVLPGDQKPAVPYDPYTAAAHQEVLKLGLFYRTKLPGHTL